LVVSPGAGTTFFRYDGRYFEVLIICAVVLLAAAEIVSAIRSAGAGKLTSSTTDDLLELKEINARLVKVQLAIERLERS
jgi:hypothetical protein